VSHVTTYTGGFERKDTTVTKVHEWFWQAVIAFISTPLSSSCL
jgi:hypothetical protein